MCGIFGAFYKKTETWPDEDVLRNVAGTLKHRGPDSSGIHAGPGIGLVHTRLSLLDLSARSNQPFWDRTGQHCLVYNGEIYNFQEIRTRLEQQGVTFRTTSDTEVLLEALLRWDLACVLPQLEGMFAFGIFDSRENTLTLARDRFGMKPLYVYENEDVLVFSSEIKAISHFSSLEPDLLSISSFVQGFGGPTKNHTFFKDIRSVPPGDYVQVSRGQPVRQSTFFSIPDFWDEDQTRELEKCPLKTVVDKTEELLFTSVKKHLIADAPVGGLCSGGIDSSLIMAMAAKIHNNLAVFHADVTGPRSEQYSARALAKHLKLDLKSIAVDEDDFLEALPEVMRHYEHPFSYHPNSVPFLRVSQLASRHGVKAVLSGEGSDECFLGYDYLALDHPFMFYRKIPHQLQAFISKVPKLRALMPRVDAPEYKILVGMLNRFEVMLDDEMIASRLSQFNGAATLGHRRSMELLNYHLRTLLHRNDSLGMASSIEARFPFLDHDLVKLAVNMPHRAKIRFGLSSDPSHRFIRDKWVIREIARRYLPYELCEKPKQGFSFNGCHKLQISPRYFYDSPVSALFGLSAKAIHFLLDKGPNDLKMKLLHLDVWSHICLYRLPEAQLLKRLKDHIKFAVLPLLSLVPQEPCI